MKFIVGIFAIGAFNFAVWAQKSPTPTPSPSQMISLASQRWILIKIETDPEKQNVSGRKPATRQSLRDLQPLPSLKKQIPFKRTFSQQEYQLITLGFIPQDMDEKWFVFFEDNKLYFHSSWTGICIYQLEFEPSGDDYAVKSVWVNRDPKHYSETDDDFDASLLSHLIDTLLLGEIKFFVNAYNLQLKDEKIKRPYIEFNLDPEGGFSKGFGGCNDFAAVFKTQEKNIKLLHIDPDKKSCADEKLNAQQAGFFSKLKQITRFELQKNILKLYAGDKLLLTFEGKSKDSSGK